MTNFPGAILAINGVATTCEFALIDNQAAFAAASCFQFTNGKLDTSATYSIYFSATADDDASTASINPNDIHIHPQYDPVTLANNIAVAEYDFTDRGSWVNYIAVYRSEWSSQFYVRRRLIDASSQKWAGPFVNGYTGTSASCQTQSPLYSQNQNIMGCNQIQTTNSWNKNCPMPYGSIYGVVSEGMAIGGLYSHSFMFDADFCSGQRGLYYFVLLGNYVSWGESVIGRNINKLVDNFSAYEQSGLSSSFSMTDVSSPNPGGMYLYAGDLKSPVAWNPSVAALSTSSTLSSSTSTAASSPSTQGMPGQENDGNSSTNSDPSLLPGAANDGNASVDINVPDDNTAQGDTGSDTEDYLNPADHKSMFPQPTNISYSDSPSVVNGGNGNSEPGVIDAHGKLSRGAIIAIAVSVPVAVIIIAVSGFLLFKKQKWKIRLPKKLPFTKRKRNTRQELVEQIGGASEEEQLPSYDEIHYTSRLSQLTANTDRPYI
ncbi:hypothetical protein LPJ74_004338 [Coemansia sp. RSA 1843]|nr:hypothetical protein LPJ74_004338 [Coemansia sp. RSA 1843]